MKNKNTTVDNLETTTSQNNNNEEVMEEENKEKDQTKSSEQQQPSFFSKVMGKVLETVGGAVGISPKKQADDADFNQHKEKEYLQNKQEQEDGSYEGLGVGRVENPEAHQIRREKEV